MKVEAVGATSRYNFLRQLGLEKFNAKNIGSLATARGGSVKGKKSVGMRDNGENDDLYDMLRQIGLVENKFTFLKMMKRGSLIGLIKYLSKEQMVMAMRLFPKIMLVRMLGKLPKELLLKLLLHVIPLKNFLSLFKSKVLFNILHSKRLNVRELVNGFEFLPKAVLQKLMTDITGQDTAALNKPELLSMFRELDKLLILQGLRKMGQKSFLELVFQLTKKDPKLLLRIPRGELIKVMNTIPKPTLTEMFRLLPESMLVNYISQLPQKALLLALYQMDNAVFQHILIHQFPHLIKSLGAAA